MRFQCSQCGKRYATADVPVPGRIYRLKCKACGNLIVVKGSEAAEAAAQPAAPAPVAPSLPAAVAPPTPPAPTPPPAVIPPAMTPPPVTPPATTGEPYKPPVGGGYVDLFADGMATSSTALPVREKTPGPAASIDDPFARAAKPEPSPALGPFVDTTDPPPSRDPFADTRAALARAETPVPDASPRLATPRVPEIPRPPQAKQRPIALMLAPGIVLLAALVGVVIWRTGAKKPAPATAPVTARAEKPAEAPKPPPPQAAEPAPAPPPAAAVAQPAPAPVTAEAPPPVASAKAPEKAEKPAPRPEPKKQKPARQEKQPEKVARAEPEKAPPPPPVVEKPAEKPAEKFAAAAEKPAGAKGKGPDTDWEAVAAQEGPSTLSPEDIRKVMAANRKVLDACLTNPGRGMDQKLPARQVVLKFTIQPNGTAGYPTIDEVVTSTAPVGQCLKGAVKLIGFPSFDGDPVKAEYPIQIPAS